MARYYPILLTLHTKRALVVGGGPVGERKVHGLLDAGGIVRAVSLTWTEGLQDLAQSGRIEAITAPYCAEHLRGIALAFAATDDRAVNAQVAADARSLGIPVNVADSPEESDFITPSVLRRGDLCISISTGGNHPLLAARIRDELEARFGPEYAEYIELLGKMREYTLQEIALPERRRQAMASLLLHETELRALLREGRLEDAYRRAQTLILAALSE
ncbi:MAG: bifunctional precorrin-2 dehydrogenase/sirohydrochlorin ferrochelatase [Chloroherpetonaceae bacterium]|nr:bifunctional precorrin-2 dehydrogenase/sirohydrochlorin ferrochelatase [Chthonomonadaceae bacterium]MDW8209009.1 bifunctional precorrin-2 dehydrogenase/sirohydrochlorin ferrochelatase [Chloroherpetonaceae bacterium]